MASYRATRPVIATARGAVDSRFMPTNGADRFAAWVAATAPLLGIALVALTTSLMHV